MLLLPCLLLPALLPAAPRKAQKTGSIYHKDWTDFNKNGIKDVYEDPSAALEDRVEDLLGRMTLEEKTCQMATLYGYRRVLKDQLPTPAWKDAIFRIFSGSASIVQQPRQPWV